MSNTNFDELLNAGCHFGHLTRKWNPKMAPYIFMERNDIHIIDLNKTAIMLDKASAALKQIAKSGRKILFVATKKQAKDIVAEKISNINMPYVTERWPGGMLTNSISLSMASRILSSVRVSTLLVASSSMSIFASDSIARAIVISCFCPFDRLNTQSVSV